MFVTLWPGKDDVTVLLTFYNKKTQLLRVDWDGYESYASIFLHRITAISLICIGYAGVIKRISVAHDSLRYHHAAELAIMGLRKS